MSIAYLFLSGVSQLPYGVLMNRYLRQQGYHVVEVIVGDPTASAYFEDTALSRISIPLPLLAAKIDMLQEKGLKLYSDRVVDILKLKGKIGGSEHDRYVFTDQQQAYICSSIRKFITGKILVVLPTLYWEAATGKNTVVFDAGMHALQEPSFVAPRSCRSEKEAVICEAADEVIVNTGTQQLFLQQLYNSKSRLLGEILPETYDQLPETDQTKYGFSSEDSLIIVPAGNEIAIGLDARLSFLHDILKRLPYHKLVFVGFSNPNTVMDQFSDLPGRIFFWPSGSDWLSLIRIAAAMVAVSESAANAWVTPFSYLNSRGTVLHISDTENKYQPASGEVVQMVLPSTHAMKESCLELATQHLSGLPVISLAHAG